MILKLILTATLANACFYEIEGGKVIDGDTIKDSTIKMDFGITLKKTIRLLGIDTPEMRGGSDQEKIKANLAKDRLETIMNACKKPRIIPAGHDSFGRLLAKLYCGNDNISDLLIKEGLGKKW